MRSPGDAAAPDRRARTDPYVPMDPSLSDQPSAVRDGEQLDLARLDAYLRQAVAGLHGSPALRQFRGGASNLTYQIDYGARSLVLRRPPFGRRHGAAHDMLRESAVMRALAPVYSDVPQVLAVCDDATVLGCPFYVMQRIDGIILRRELPRGLTLDAAQARRLCLNVIDRLVALHAIDVGAAGLGGLDRGDGYVRRQVEGWSARWQRARTDDAPSFARVMAWLEQRQPARDNPHCVIHNDFRFDNVVLDAADPLRVIGVLDWEMATVGDPLMDLGNALAYWIEAGDDAALQAMRRQPTHLPGMLTRAQAVAYYAARSGRAVGDIAFYQVQGVFRLAVIAQQIYQRWLAGDARNPEFASLAQVVGQLERRCLALIEGAD